MIKVTFKNKTNDLNYSFEAQFPYDVINKIKDSVGATITIIDSCYLDEKWVAKIRGPVYYEEDGKLFGKHNRTEANIPAKDTDNCLKVSSAVVETPKPKAKAKPKAKKKED